MASNSILPLFLLLAVSSALDMSIIDYDQSHGLLPRPKRIDAEVRAMFESWLIKNGKNYNALGEKEVRYQIFKDHLTYIDQHNAGNHSYELGLTGFADLTNAEYRELFTGGVLPPRTMTEADESSVTMTSDEVGAVPDTVDWRDTGAIAPVRNQGRCESCWAFAGAAATTALHHQKTGYLVELSPQQLVDCAISAHLPNCGPGWPERGLAWIKSNGGITTEADYPYTAVQGTCDRKKLSNRAVSIRGYYSKYPHRDENKLKTQVANQPVVGCVEAQSTDFQLYKKGIYKGPCGTTYNHAILIIGYGTENGEDYWLIKNSWGTNWGDKGYGKIYRGANSCAIADYISYPK